MSTIHIPATPWQEDVIRFVRSSALYYCTTVETREHDLVSVTSNWPAEAFSTGEKILWRLLESITGGDLDAAFNRLDDTNLRALIAVVSSVLTQAVAPVTLVADPAGGAE